MHNMTVFLHNMTAERENDLWGSFQNPAIILMRCSRTDLPVTPHQRCPREETVLDPELTF